MRQASSQQKLKFSRLKLFGSSKLRFDQSIQVLRNDRLIEALDHFVQEAGDDEPLRRSCRNATGTKIEHFVFVDLAGRGAVSATDIVGENFQAGHRVRFRIVAQKKIAN